MRRSTAQIGLGYRRTVKVSRSFLFQIELSIPYSLNERLPLLSVEAESWSIWLVHIGDQDIALGYRNAYTLSARNERGETALTKNPSVDHDIGFHKITSFSTDENLIANLALSLQVFYRHFLANIGRGRFSEHSRDTCLTNKLTGEGCASTPSPVECRVSSHLCALVPLLYRLYESRRSRWTHSILPLRTFPRMLDSRIAGRNLWSCCRE